MGSTVSTTIGNAYHKKVWVKMDFESEYVKMSSMKTKAEVGGGPTHVGSGVEITKEYDWHKITAQFNPIKTRDYKIFDFENSGKKVIYLTIIADDEEIICNCLSCKKDKNILITEDGTLRPAQRNAPLKQVVKDCGFGAVKGFGLAVPDDQFQLAVGIVDEDDREMFAQEVTDDVNVSPRW